jgi:hypothetical protein
MNHSAVHLNEGHTRSIPYVHIPSPIFFDAGDAHPERRFEPINYTACLPVTIL